MLLYLPREKRKGDQENCKVFDVWIELGIKHVLSDTGIRRNTDVILGRNQRIGSICWIMLSADCILLEPPGSGFA